MSATATLYLDHHQPAKVDTRPSEYGGQIIRVDLDGVVYYLPGMGAEAAGYARAFAERLLRAADAVEAAQATGVLCDDRR